MMNLIAITANQNVGYIDWEPYIPIIFSRIMRSIDLPVCYKNMKSARNQSLWSSSVASKCTRGWCECCFVKCRHCTNRKLSFCLFLFCVSLDCVGVGAENQRTTIFDPIVRRHRNVPASGQYGQMGECHQRDYRSNTEIFVRSLDCGTIQTAYVETTGTGWVTDHVASLLVRYTTMGDCFIKCISTDGTGNQSRIILEVNEAIASESVGKGR